MTLKIKGFYLDLSRIIALQPMYFGDYEEDQVITLSHDASFAGGNSEEAFKPEKDLGGEAIFTVKNAAPARPVDYEDKKEVESLSAFKSEDEFLVPKGTHFRIDWVNKNEEETQGKSIEVELVYLKDGEYKQALADGAEESEGIL